MKKQYENPTAEKITFDYREQVVATSGGCGDHKPGLKPDHKPDFNPPRVLLISCGW